MGLQSPESALGLPRVPLRAFARRIQTGHDLQGIPISDHLILPPQQRKLLHFRVDITASLRGRAQKEDPPQSGGAGPLQAKGLLLLVAIEVFEK